MHLQKLMWKAFREKLNLHYECLQNAIISASIYVPFAYVDNSKNLEKLFLLSFKLLLNVVKSVVRFEFIVSSQVMYKTWNEKYTRVNISDICFPCLIHSINKTTNKLLEMVFFILIF